MLLGYLNQENVNSRHFLIHDGSPYHIETIPLIWSENQWTGFYMISTSSSL